MGLAWGWHGVGKLFNRPFFKLHWAGRTCTSHSARLCAARHQQTLFHSAVAHDFFLHAELQDPQIEKYAKSSTKTDNPKKHVLKQKTEVQFVVFTHLGHHLGVASASQQTKPCCSIVIGGAGRGGGASVFSIDRGGGGDQSKRCRRSQPELGTNTASLRAPNRPLGGSVAFLGHLGLNTVQKSKGKAKNPLNGARQ
jgi:hypothetical protein